MIITFEKELREKYYKLLDSVFDSNYWSEGKMQQCFEDEFSQYVGLHSAAVSSGGAGLLSILDYIDVTGFDVVVPANTFWATPQSVKKAGGNVIYADCNTNDLCISYSDMIDKVTENTKVIIVVHIGGHIAFDIEKISDFCNNNNIYLVEDCAHAHGASYRGRKAGSFGFAGSYSFYATKTMPLGDGGMVVSKDEDFIQWLKKYRNYGKTVEDGVVKYPIKSGFNFRMNEFTAALGIVQLERIHEIIEWKSDLAAKYDLIFDYKVTPPDAMISGFYKYIIFDPIKINHSSGKVFERTDFGYVIDDLDIKLENSEWIACNHQCPPIWFGWEYAECSVDELSHLLLGNN